MINFIRKNRWPITLWCLGYFALSFLIGVMETGSERAEMAYQTNEKGEREWKSLGKSGCRYKSFSSLVNPGYIIGCELFRARYDYDRIEKVFK